MLSFMIKVLLFLLWEAKHTNLHDFNPAMCSYFMYNDYLKGDDFKIVLKGFLLAKKEWTTNHRAKGMWKIMYNRVFSKVAIIPQ